MLGERRGLHRNFLEPQLFAGRGVAVVQQVQAGKVKLISSKGDTIKGRAIFERAESSCITCHRIGDKGVDFARHNCQVDAIQRERAEKRFVRSQISIAGSASVAMAFR